MTLLLENPLPIWAAGAVLTALGLVFVFARRSLASILMLVAVVALTLLMVFTEKYVVTDREQVEVALAQLTEALEANDLAAVLALMTPTAVAVRSDAESLMPQVNVKDAGTTAVRVELDDSSDPLRATSFFRGRVDGVHSRSGSRLFFFDEVEIDWQRSGDHWLIVDYRVYQRGEPIDAVRSVRGNRPVR